MPDRVKISIDKLIGIVKAGGSVRTGMDVYNDRGVLLLEKDVRVDRVKPLEMIKSAGIVQVPVDAFGNGGLWDQNGVEIALPRRLRESPPDFQNTVPASIVKRIHQIREIKEQADEKYQKAKACIRKVLDDIRRSGGEFDYQDVQGIVSEIFDFLVENENAFTYLTREIFSYDDYLYNHSINVCTIATAGLQKFNRSFSKAVNLFLDGLSFENLIGGRALSEESFVLFNDEEIRSITAGYFLHDIGKVAIPDNVLNKTGPLNHREYDLVKLHSYDKGQELLDRNNIQDASIRNIVRYHHCSLYKGEPNCYPTNIAPAQLPAYVKVCKLADIFDAMTSKRCYKDAYNPISVVSDMFRKYANRDRMLQFIVDSFIRTVGIYPVGSVVNLRNGQQAFVIDNEGPIVVPFTTKDGTPFKLLQDPINLKEAESRDPEFAIDRRAPQVPPAEAYVSMPAYLK